VPVYVLNKQTIKAKITNNKGKDNKQ